MLKKVSNESINQAYARIKGHIVNTPLISVNSINDKFNSKVFFKLESEQKTGSFKIRGALNKLLQLTSADKKKGVIAYSSGNHAQAVSYGCKLLGINSMIVMPKDAPKIKILKTKKNGADIIFYDRLTQSRENIAEDLANKTGRVLVKPFDDQDIISSQGTIGLEIYNELKRKEIEPDVLLCCCSGGGLIAGISTYLKNYFSKLSIYSVEPQYYDDMKKSLERGRLVSINPTHNTLCDALTCKTPGKLTFEINKRNLSGGFVVNDSEVKKAISLLNKELNVISEPGGAASVASFLKNYKNFHEKVVIIIVSGGNIDNTLFNKIIKNHE